MPEQKKSPYTLASERASKERSGVASNIGQSLAQSGADMTNRLTKNGAVGFPSAVVKEIGSGYKQIADPIANYAASADNAINAQIGQKSDINTDAALPFLIGSETAQQVIAERDAPTISDPSASAPSPLTAQTAAQPEQSTQSVGLNGVITDPTGGGRQAPVKNAYEDANSVIANSANPQQEFVKRGNQNILARGPDAQRSFSDGNYTPQATSNGAIVDPNAAPVSQTPVQDQLRQMQLMRLREDSAMEIDNSLSYDERKTMAGKRNAAQKTLGMMLNADTADKNRASNFEAAQNKRILASQKAANKAEQAKLKEKRFFNPDNLQSLDMGEAELSPEELSGLSMISNSEGAAAKQAILKMPVLELRKRLKRGELNRYGVNGERIVRALGMGYKLDGAK